jgi:hypothetical protein
MILINSANFIVSDLQADFGKIPPAFIPLGSKRLYEAQATLIKRSLPNEEIFLSLPVEYEISQSDLEALNALEIRILQNVCELSLKESIKCSLRKIPQNLESIRILHGDTLFAVLPKELDVINESKPNSHQSWFSESTDSKGEIVWSGYFAFSDIVLLSKALNEGKDFETSILYYDESLPMIRNFAITWQDLGHSSTYYLTRQNHLITRDFNSLLYKNGILTKCGNTLKIEAEVYWYRNIPLPLRKYIPQLFSTDQNGEASSYSMEYLPIPALSEILVFGNQSTPFWEQIFFLLEEFLEKCRNDELGSLNFLHNGEFMASLSLHVSERLDLIDSSDCPISQDDKIVVNGAEAISVREIALSCLKIINEGSVIPSVVHGDLCLGNVLFESRMNQIRLIDPRGRNFEGSKTIYGDQRYDLAKLAHSFIGHYDSIIAEYFHLEQSKRDEKWNLEFKINCPDSAKRFEDLFYEKFLKNQPHRDDVIAMMIILFITMSPLHSEDSKRQLAFLSNSISLYYQYFGSAL